jgi:type III secretion system FlhB-like substrate exporter
MDEKIAIALKEGEVIAAASGAGAQEMLKIAGEHEVKIVEDQAKLEEYFKLKTQGLPLEIYEVVSEILSFINYVHHAWVNREEPNESKEEITAR